MRGLNFNKLGEHIWRSWLHKMFVSEFGYRVMFSNASGSKLTDSRVMLTTTPAGGGVGEISIPTVAALPTTEPPEYI